MIIILEGFDGSGKSTLAAKLAKDLNFQSFHPGKPPKNFIEGNQRLQDQNGIFNFADKLNIVMDRTTCISHNAYALGLCGLNYSPYLKNLCQKDILVIYCDTNGLEDQSFLVSEHDDEKTIEHAKNNVREICLRYYDIIQFIEFNQGQVIRYDYKQTDYNELLVTLFKQLHSK